MQKVGKYSSRNAPCLCLRTDLCDVSDVSLLSILAARLVTGDTQLVCRGWRVLGPGRAATLPGAGLAGLAPAGQDTDHTSRAPTPNTRSPGGQTPGADASGHQHPMTRHQPECPPHCNVLNMNAAKW